MTERLLLRLGLLSTGGILLYGGTIASWEAAIHLYPGVVIFILSLYILAFANLLLGVADESLAQKGKSLLLPSLIFVLLGNSYIRLTIVNQPYGTDGMALTHYAGILFLQGENPYRVTGDLSSVVEHFGVPAAFVTQTLNGSYIDRLLSYPALHFLVYVPFIALGVNDMRWVTVLFEVATLLLLFVKAPSPLRPVILLPLFLNPDAWIYFTTGSVTDFLWVLPVVGLALALKSGRLGWGGLLFGLAGAIKQVPWPLAPFLLVWAWNYAESGDWRRRLGQALTFFIPGALVFAIINAPFFLEAPGDWFTGIFYPYIARMMPDGQGLSMLTKTGLLSLPQEFYTLAMATVEVVLIANYIVYFRRLKWSLWLFPAIVFWVSYRSFQNYFLYWVPLLLLALHWAAQESENAGTPSSALSQLRRLAAPVSMGAGALGLVVAAAYFLMSAGNGLEIEVLRMEDVEATGKITQMEVWVTNSSAVATQLRFSVMWDSYPRYWQTRGGPAQLGPHSSATYLIHADKQDNAVPYLAAFLVRVNDADGTYYYRSRPVLATISKKEAYGSVSP